MTKESKGFHITIIDNETGETLHDADVCAIVGAFNEGERTGALGLTKCNAFDIAATIKGAKTAIQHLCANHPELELLVKVLDKMPQEIEEDK